MIAGLILAGGRSSRMGGRDKALAGLAGRTLLAHAIDLLGPQVAALAVSANGDLNGAAGSLPVLKDLVPGFQGPLAGLHAGMAWASTLAGVDRLATVSVDAPFLPGDLVARLSIRMDADGSPIALSASAGRSHPTCALWELSLLPDLERFLREHESRRVMDFIGSVPHSTEAFAFDGIDPFFNVNTQDDLALAARRLEAAR